MFLGLKARTLCNGKNGVFMPKAERNIYVLYSEHQYTICYLHCVTRRRSPELHHSITIVPPNCEIVVDENPRATTGETTCNQRGQLIGRKVSVQPSEAVAAARQAGESSFH